MKTLAWHNYLKEQRERYGKVLYTVTELSNVAGTTPHNVNEELRRLVERGVLTRFSSGCYGQPDGVTVEALVSEIDPNGYVTGAYALNRHNLITQSVYEVDCFTNKRHGRSRIRETPLGRMKFICVKSGVYNPPADVAFAGPEQALMDYLYIAGRSGYDPVGQFSFRNMDRLDQDRLDALAASYPKTTVRAMRGLYAEVLP